jgi:hypothetical protein
MNFIEQLFGISLDAGSGLLEACLIAVPLGVLVLRAVLTHATNPSRRPITRPIYAAFSVVILALGALSAKGGHGK